jgi:hypothetical protein
MDLTDKLNS